MVSLTSFALATTLVLLYPVAVRARPSRLRLVTAMNIYGLNSPNKKYRRQRQGEDDDEPDEDEPDEDEGGSRPTSTRSPTASQTFPTSAILSPASSGFSSESSPVIAAPSSATSSSATFSATHPAPSSQVADNASSSRINKDAIIGGSVGGGIGLLLLGMLIAACCTRSRRAKKKPKRMSTIREFFRPSLRRSQRQPQERQSFMGGVSLRDPPVDRGMANAGDTGPVSIGVREQSPLNPPSGPTSSSDESGGNSKGIVVLTYPPLPLPNPHDEGSHLRDEGFGAPRGHLGANMSMASLASNPPAYSTGY